MKLLFDAIRLACLAGALVSACAHAGTLRCDGCTYNDVYDRALAAGFGDHMVMNFRDAQLHRFAVRADQDAQQTPGRPPILVAFDLGVHPEDVAAFQALSDVVNSNGGSLKLNFALKPDNPIYPGDLTGFSSREITWSTSNREFVGRAVATADFPGAAGRLVAALTSAITAAAASVVGETRLRVVVFFRDGSSAVFVIDKDHSTQAEYELGSARDAEGNIVLDQSHIEGGQNHSDLIGEHSFRDAQNFGNWFDRARQLGIPVTTSFSSGTRINRPVIVECTISGGKLMCRGRYATI